jgi:hypothetical protein
MLAATLAVFALAGADSSLPTIWSVNVGEGDYVINRWDDGKVRRVYREPKDQGDTNGPHGAIQELWPSPKGSNLAFYRYSARNFSKDGRGEKRLLIYEVDKKALSSMWSDDVLPLDEDMLGTNYFSWLNETDYRVPLLFPYDIINVDFASLDPKKWDDDTFVSSGYKTWDTYFDRFRKKTWVYEMHPRIPSEIDMMGKGTLRLTYPNERVVISKADDTILTLKPGTFVRELRFDGDRWLTISTYHQDVFPVGGFHLGTTFEYYTYRSYAIDWAAGKIIYENDAYLMRIRDKH